MALTKNGFKELLTETEVRLQAAIQTEINGAEKRLATRFDTRFKATEKRLEVKIVGERKILHIFFDQQLRKTNGMFEDVAQQPKQFHTAVTHALDKHADLKCAL